MEIEIINNWFKRNWKWVLPIISVFLFSWIYFGLLFMKRSFPYKQALAIANKSDGLSEIIGNPVEAGWWLTGEIKYGPTGVAWLSIPVEGPNGNGIISLYAAQTKSNWKYEEIFVDFGNDKCLDLLSDSEKNCRAFTLYQ